MIVALTGLTGSGKTTVAEFFQNREFQYFRFGQVTEDNLAKQGLANSPENNKVERERIRRELGMDAFAKLAEPTLRHMHAKGNVVADDMMSFEEYIYLKKIFKNNINVIAVCASPKTRHFRLTTRTYRPYTEAQANDRDIHEIEILHKGGTIAMADHTLINEGSVDDLNKQLENLWNKLGVKD